MTDPASTIFLSYASQDAAVASRLGEALRAHGLQVWFDQSELRGGDAWDQLIRRRIRECALFMPVISANTQTRLEGYFRLEWRLAVERTHLMADGKAFLIPVAVEAVSERDAQVPEAFRSVQWTYLPGGEVTPDFVQRVAHLLPGQLTSATATPAPARTASVATAPRTTSSTSFTRRALPLAAAVAVLGAAALTGLHFAHRGTSAAPAADVTAATPVPPAAAPGAAALSSGPPEHSVAVLPFTNLSGDPKDEYFSDGLSEELLNTLAAVQGLKVAARTSSFSFKGRNEPVGEIARQLNVASILEGSVRRSGSHIRVSTELIDASTGFQRWSQTYDRDVRDVLAVQSDIATAVAGALKVKLLQTGSGGVEVGGTENPKAFDAFLRGQQASYLPLSPQTHEQVVTALAAAIALDPTYANAYLLRAAALVTYSFNGPVQPEEARRLAALGLADARKAAELAPTLGAAYSLIGYTLAGERDLAGAAAQFAKGVALSPGDARVYTSSADFLSSLGRFDEAIVQARRAVELDPLNADAYRTFASVYFLARRYAEAIAQAQRGLQMAHADTSALRGWQGLAYFGLGKYAEAKSTCEAVQLEWVNLTCLALANDKLGHHAESDAALAKLVKDFGDSSSYQQAEIFAQRGELDQAMALLGRALSAGDPGVQSTKMDPLLDPLRKDPRFQRYLADLKFPD